MRACWRPRSPSKGDPRSAQPRCLPVGSEALPRRPSPRGRPSHSPLLPIERYSRDRYRWPPRFVKLLGETPNAALAAKVGLYPESVARERLRRGIGPSRPCQPPIEWTRARIAALGTDTDG